MVASHVAHDCIVGDKAILTNQATLGGHVQLGEHAIVGGLAAIQQRCRVGAHVFIGLTLLAIVVVRAFRGHFTPAEHRGVEVPGIYWHFVDVMWVIVYLSVYII